MKIFILTAEPYHDNSTVVGVYTDEALALAELRSRPNPDDINEDDYRLTEWDTDSNAEGRTWDMTGKQIHETGPVPYSSKPEWHPVRKEFTFSGPEGKS